MFQLDDSTLVHKVPTNLTNPMSHFIVLLVHFKNFAEICAVSIFLFIHYLIFLPPATRKINLKRI